MKADQQAERLPAVSSITTLPCVRVGTSICRIVSCFRKAPWSWQAAWPSVCLWRRWRRQVFNAALFGVGPTDAAAYLAAGGILAMATVSSLPRSR